MSKVLESSLGNLEYLLLGLTFLGVLYLVMKQANLNVSVSKNEGMLTQTAGVLGFNTDDDAGNRAGYYPHMKGREGMSLSAMEPPSWHMTPYDPSEIDQAGDLASEPDYGKKDGMYSKAAKIRQGAMDRALAGAMSGANSAL